jgi:hypothetical protein
VSLLDFLDLRYQNGNYADPEKTTEIGRVLQNGTSVGVAASLVVVQRPALVFGFTVSSVAAQFIQIFDASALPANAAVPSLPSFPVGATSTIANVWIPPRAFRNGVVICNSSTQHTKTIGSADCIFDVQYL